MIFKWLGQLRFKTNKLDSGIFENTYWDLFDFEESLFVVHFLRESDCFVDVGANVGHFSLLASGCAGCKTIAFEPVPSTFEKLKENIDLNQLRKLIITHQCGISDSPDTLFFSKDRHTVNQIVDSSYPHKIAVKVNTLDQLLSAEKIQLIKLDIEGYEWFALKGAEKILSNEHLSAIIIELNDSGEKYGITNKDIDLFLHAKGFAPYQYSPVERKLTALKNFNTEANNTIYLRNINTVQNRLKSAKRIKIGKRYY